MKKYSSKDLHHGFTLLEAIVVLSIVAILAAIAIPQYHDYIQSSRQNSVNDLAETASTIANEYVRRTGNNPTVTQLKLTYDPALYSISISGNAITISEIGYTPAKSSTKTFR